jgi:hypothetical protein
MDIVEREHHAIVSGSGVGGPLAINGEELFLPQRGGRPKLLLMYL